MAALILYTGHGYSREIHISGPASGYGRADHAGMKAYQSENAPVSLRGTSSRGNILAAGFLFLVVVLRSYVGLVSAFQWKSIGLWSAVYIAAVVLGKMGGGFACVIMGIKKASVISLGLAAVLFIFSDIPLCGVAAVFFFNMTMPVTLWAMARILPGCKGFSFGLLTFALFLGFIPVYLELPVWLSTTAGFSAASLISVIFLMTGLMKVLPRDNGT